MAAATKRPGQVLGLHFFNPVPLMKLVEVVRTILIDDTAAKAASDWVRDLGKTRCTHKTRCTQRTPRPSS
jgi:3-hydroxybutyryl-CoA dehydrogenase